MKKNNITTDQLAAMIKKSFNNTDKKVDFGFKGVKDRLDKVENKLRDIENIILDDHKNRIDKLESRIEYLENILNLPTKK